MKTFYKITNILLFTAISLVGFSQQQTTVVTSSSCNFTYNFNSSGEGFSAPSIYSDPNDFGLYWDGTQLAETSGTLFPMRTASTISGIYINTESARTTVGFDYVVPVGTEYRIRVISGQFNPPLEILATTANGPVWSSFPSTSGSLCLELQDADLTLNSQIRYEITFRTINPGIITFDNFKRAVQNSPLPVTFLSFISREADNGKIKLLWNVGQEINVRAYEVESSTDGSNFTTIGYIPATGNSNYFFTITSPVKGLQFFRIKNVDIDNRFKYSGILRMQHNDDSPEIKLYPVPATEMLFVQHRVQNTKAKITIVNSTGNIIFQAFSQPGSHQTSMNVKNLSPGIYFIKYEDESGSMQKTSFIKQ